jgi:hypothetical protein
MSKVSKILLAIGLGLLLIGLPIAYFGNKYEDLVLSDVYNGTVWDDVGGLTILGALASAALSLMFWNRDRIRNKTLIK